MPKTSVLRNLAEQVALIVAYVALDWISFFDQLAPIGITPWNPAPGMALAVMIRRGRGMAPTVFVASIMADILVRKMTAPLLLSLATSAVIAWGYAAAAELLRGMRVTANLARLRDVLWLTGVAVMAALVVALAYVGIFGAVGLVAEKDFPQAVSRYWIGDMIGIAVVVPLLLTHPWRSWREPPPGVQAEAMLMAAAIIAALWAITGAGEGLELHLIYLLFLPLIWAGIRFGLTGASLANLLAQAGLIVSFKVMDFHSSTVTELQYLMLSVATGSLYLGAAVGERRAIEDALRARRDELTRFSRLSLAGEMAAALAHELNQPLMATIAFSRAAQRMLAQGNADPAAAAGALDRAVAEAQRAGNIVKSLREFIGKGGTSRSLVDFATLAADALALVSPDCSRHAVRLSTQIDRGLPQLLVDRVQIQQVLLNLVRNALDAVAGSPPPRVIEVTASRTADGEIEIGVRDSGPGIAPEIAENLFEPFNTTKASGMGLGLSICRSIVEAHGGRLWLASEGGKGASFRFTLPVAEEI